MTEQPTAEHHYLCNLIAAIGHFEQTMQQYYTNESSHDLLYEKACIGLEYNAFLSFLTCNLAASKKCLTPNILKLLSNEVYKQCQQYASLLETKYNFHGIDILSLINTRMEDYKKIYYEDFEPCGFYLLNDYPRYSNKTQDSINRCLIALGDFSLCYIKNRKAATFDDLHVVLVLDIFEMPFYNELFDQISVICISYYNLFNEIASKNFTDISNTPAASTNTIQQQNNSKNKPSYTENDKFYHNTTPHKPVKKKRDNPVSLITTFLTIVTLILSGVVLNQTKVIQSLENQLQTNDELVALVKEYKYLTYSYYAKLNQAEKWGTKTYNAGSFKAIDEYELRNEKDSIFNHDLKEQRSELVDKTNLLLEQIESYGNSNN